MSTATLRLRIEAARRVCDAATGIELPPPGVKWVVDQLCSNEWGVGIDNETFGDRCYCFTTSGEAEWFAAILNGDAAARTLLPALLDFAEAHCTAHEAAEAEPIPARPKRRGDSEQERRDMEAWVEHRALHIGWLKSHRATTAALIEALDKVTRAG